MADPINVSGTANTPIPVFKGDGYEHWSVRMRTILRSRELWDIVNLGVTDYGDNLERNRKEAKDDARAMVVIQQGVHDVLFSRIAAANTAQEAWDILRMEFQGDSQVQAVKLQGLRRDFENLMMKENEAIGDYFSRVMAVASQQRGFGEDVSDQKIVEKILRSLTERYDHVVPSIEVAYDLSQLSAVKLMGCLQSQEERLNSRSGDPKTGDTGRSDEQALQVYQPYRRQNNDGGARGRRRGGFRGRGRGRSQSDKNKVPQCYHCNRYGHIKRDCWFADEEPVNAVANNQEEEGANDEVAHLFMAITTSMTDEDDSMTSEFTNPSLWFVDSGCSNHMTSAKGSFVMLNTSFKISVRLGDKKNLEVEGKGTVQILMKDGTLKFLEDVYYAPKLEYNLLSVGQLMRKGYSLLFDDNACSIVHKETKSELMKVQLATNNMFPLDATRVKDNTAVVHAHELTKLWHCRFGHLHTHALQQLQKNKMVQGLPQIKEIKNCEGCVLGKQHKLSFQPSQKRATRILEIIHSDVCGPMPVNSLGRSKYFLLFVDDFSRMTWVYFLEKKSEVFSKFKIFKTMVEKQSGHSVKILRTDRGGEFCSNEFNMFCETHGIKRHLTAPFTPEQNGVCERKNRTVVEMAQCMLQAKGMPSYFWAEAVATAVHILNLSPTKAVDNKTPIHMWSGERPNVNDLRIFGCLCYGLTPAQQRHKFEPKSEKCILIGYSSQTKGYRLYNPKTKQIITRRDVKFFEESAWDWSNEKGRDNNHLWDLSTFDPMILDPTSETNDLNEAGHENNTIQVNDVPSTSQNHNAVAGPSNINEVITDSSSPPQKVRDLNDVYSNCPVIEDYVRVAAYEYAETSYLDDMRVLAASYRQ
ncbi:hypothetical protein E3N88_31684 [Mikania micrantha]|uniref:Integrase catalytic domain-containing protein n=1 Tax=Mikania micrantha TaxID=192012 RepID=A0A5N6M688_9ASTR|nr:hypothetical protein E3N88_31684 [Mikania micrantha]